MSRKEFKCILVQRITEHFDFQTGSTNKLKWFSENQKVLAQNVNQPRVELSYTFLLRRRLKISIFILITVLRLLDCGHNYKTIKNRINVIRQIYVIKSLSLFVYIFPTKEQR